MKREATARRYGLKVEAADSCRSLLRLEPFAIQFAKYFSFCTHLQRAQLLLGWCSSCSVGAFLARLVHLRQVHPLSVPPFASAVRSDSVRHPIGFRPPSDRFPSAVRSDSVRHPIGFRPPSVEKCWEKRCKNVVLNGNTIGDFAIFDVSVFRCFYYPHPNNLCRSVKSVGEYSAVNSVSSAYSVGKNSAVNSVHSAYSVGEYSIINSVSSAYSVGDHSVKPSMKSCFLSNFTGFKKKNAI